MASKQLVQVTWWDARDGDGTWVDEADAEEFGKEELVVHSVGFVVSDTSKYITLAGDWIPADKTYGRVVKIPRGMVVKVAVLTPSPPE